MTNIAALPRNLGGTITISRNADWRDTIQFTWPTGTMSNGVSIAGQPIDLTGIKFFSQVRPSDNTANIELDLSTDNDLLVTDNALGTLTWAVPENKSDVAGANYTSRLQEGTPYITDIIAVGDGQIINLMQQVGPTAVVVAQPVTASAIVP